MMQITDEIKLDVTIQEAIGIVNLVAKLPIEQGLPLFQKLQVQLDPYVKVLQEEQIAQEEQIGQGKEIPSPVED